MVRAHRWAIAWLVGVLAIVGCGPTAEPTATPGVLATATRAAVSTPTTAAVAPTSTRAAVATATLAAAATATQAGEVKVRPIPVLQMPAQNPLAKKGGDYRDLANDTPPDFGIWDSAVGSTLRVSIPAIDSLLDRNEFEADKNEQILANVAYDWWTDQSGTKWTFKLKEGVKFHDGKPFTCADAEFSMETIRDARDATGDELRRSPRAAWLSRVKDISCPDNYTLVMITDGQLPSLPATLAVASFAILAKHIYEGNLDLMWQGPHKAGIGAFIMDQYIPGEVVKFKRNPNYWRQPYPYLDSYAVTNLGSVTAAVSAMRVGRGEGGPNIPISTRQQMIAEGKLWQPVTGASDSFTGFQANFTRDPWKDTRFSLAMRCAVDTRKVIDTAYSGEGYEGPVFPLAKDPGGSEWAITEEEWKSVHPCHGRSGDAANMEKRRQIARDLLKDMGFTAQNPAKPTSYTTKDDQTFVAVLNDLNLVGIQVQYKTVTTSERYEIQTNATTDILQQGFVTSRRDPDHWLYEQFYSTSDRNYGRYTNAEVDALINKQSKTLDKAARYKTIQQIEKMLLKDNAKVVVRHGANTKTFSIWVKDIYWGEPSNSQNTAQKLVRVWIDPDLKAKFGGQ